MGIPDLLFFSENKYDDPDELYVDRKASGVNSARTETLTMTTRTLSEEAAYHHRHHHQ